MSRQVIQLADFDPELLIEYAIINSDLTNVYHYLQAMQAEMWPGSWEDICLGGYYGSSALLHEVVELRLLLSRDPYLLTRSTATIKGFARQRTNRDAHVRGLEAEYGYLHRIVQRLFHVHVNIGALLRANSTRPEDWDDLFDTDLPFFAPTPHEVEDAKSLLVSLRMIKRGET